MEELKPNGQRAKNAIILIWIVMALEIISLISGYFQYDLLQTVAHGGEISMETATANDLREQLIGFAYLIVYIVSAITFIMWFRRAYYNLHLKVNYLSFTEGWAAGSWFVPILNLFRPYKIMKELYVETREFLYNKGLTNYEILKTSHLVWWWTLWIISNIIGQFTFRYSMRAVTVDELIVSTVSGMIANFIGIPLSIITIQVIKNYSKVEPLLTEWSELDEIESDKIEI